VDKLRTKKDFQMALQAYLELIRADANNGNAYQWVAQCYYELEEYDAAVVACNKAVDLDQTLAIPHVILASIHLRMRDFEFALAEALKAYELSPELEVVSNCYGALLLGNGKLDQSISVLKKTLENHPKSLQAHRNLAVAYMEKRDYKRCVEERKQVFKYELSLSSVIQLLIAYEQRFALWLTLLVVAAILGAIFFKLRVLLIVPGILVIQGLLSDLEFLRKGRWKRKEKWKTLLFSSVTDFILAVITWLAYFSLRPK
jgi:tetratricopeptide (TPR) repeat protein